MAKLMNPPQKKTYTTFKKKKQPFDFKKHKKLIILVSSLLLAALVLSIGLGIFLNWYFVDTKYDSPLFKSYVVLPDFGTLGVTKEAVDKSFEYQKKSFLRSHSTFTPVTEGEIAEGYNVTIDGIGYFVTNGVVETTPYSGSKLDDYEITDVGNHVTESGASFFPEIQQAVIGKSVKEGTKTTAELKYADDYSIEELKGKTMRFEITIVSVTKTNAPDYTDAFVKSKTGFETVAAYEQALREMVERELIWSAVVSGTEIKKYPKKFIKYYSDEFDSYYKNKMETDKLTFTQLLSSLGFKDENEYNEAMLDYAQGVVKEEMVLYRLVKDEKIRVSRDEYKTELERLAKENGYSDKIDDFEESYGEDIIRRTVLWDKLKEHLRKNITISG